MLQAVTYDNKIIADPKIVFFFFSKIAFASLFALQVNLFNCFCTLLAYLNPLHLTSDSLQKRLVAQELESDGQQLPPNKLQSNKPVIAKQQRKA